MSFAYKKNFVLAVLAICSGCTPKSKMSGGSSTTVLISPLPSPTISSAVPSAVPTLSPAFQVAEVAVNYEDGGSPGTVADNDFNDSTLCFQMTGELSGSLIKSTKEQMVNATFNHKSGCSHRFEVTVFSQSGVVEYTFAYLSNPQLQGKNVQIPFKVNSRLEIRGTNSIDGKSPLNCIEATAPGDVKARWYTMNDASHFRINGVCNRAGS